MPVYSPPRPSTAILLLYMDMTLIQGLEVSAVSSIIQLSYMLHSPYWYITLSFYNTQALGAGILTRFR